MYVVFLTGGLASGKSTVADQLASYGATLLDLDQMAKEEQESESVLAALQAAFGQDIVEPSGQLNRRLLAQRAFQTPESAAQLNAICWPPVQARLSEYLVGGSCQPMQMGSMVVVQIPMLVEAPEFLPLADEVLAINAPEELRLQRAIDRGMDPADARRRLSFQATDAARAALADTVIDNSGDLATLEQAVQNWYADRLGRLF